jgi:hypothetical protein
VKDKAATINTMVGTLFLGLAVLTMLSKEPDPGIATIWIAIGASLLGARAYQGTRKEDDKAA